MDWRRSWHDEKTYTLWPHIYNDRIICSYLVSKLIASKLYLGNATKFSLIRTFAFICRSNLILPITSGAHKWQLLFLRDHRTTICSTTVLLITKYCFVYPFIFLNVTYWSPRSVNESCKQYINNSDPAINRISILLLIPWVTAGVHSLGCDHACIKPPGKILSLYVRY